MRISDWSSDVCSSDLKTLGCRFLITGRAVYLPRAIKACHAAYKHAASECPRIDMIIFDSIARHDDFCLLERSEEHTSELQSLMRISYAVFCLKKKKNERHTKETYNK